MKEESDRQDLVAYLMVLMNTQSANKMLEFKNGIYRTLQLASIENDKISSEIIDFIKIWQSSSGAYTSYEIKTNHDLVWAGVDKDIQ